MPAFIYYPVFVTIKSLQTIVKIRDGATDIAKSLLDYITSEDEAG